MFSNRAQQRRMSMSRRLLNRAGRQGRLGSLAPFVHPQLMKVPMPKTALKSTAAVRPTVSAQPKLLTSPKAVLLVETYDQVCVKFAQLEARKKALSAELVALHKLHGTSKLETDDFTVTETPGGSSHIDRAVLVKKGVKASIIEAATVKTKYTYPRVSRKKTTFEVEPAEA